MGRRVREELSRCSNSSLYSAIRGILCVSFLGCTATVGAATIDDTVRYSSTKGEKGFTVAVPTVFEGDLRQLPSKPKWQPGDPIKVTNPRHIRDIQDILPPVNQPKAGDPLVARQLQAKKLKKDSTRTAEVLVNVEGVGFNGVNPPDPTGEVGLKYYVQSTNAGGGAVLNIYNKTTGELVVDGLAMSSLQTGDCTSTLGDPIIMFDEQANRWLWTEFSSFGINKLCVLVSQTDDPVEGGWYAYGFQAPSFPDYPKFSQMGGVYYASANENTNAVYAFEREKMLAGEPAAMVRQEIPRLAGFGFNSITPVDVDGQTPAPEGSPGMFIRHRDDELHNSGNNNAENDFLEIWTLEPNFTDPDNSRVSGPMNIEVSEFNSDFNCNSFDFGCLTQKDTSQLLDPLREVVMYKSQYRNFGAHESIVGNFITNPGDNTAVLRWFELRRVGDSDWTVHDEGSYTEGDNVSRYMAGSLLDGSGNHLIAYMATGADRYPSIAFNGRKADDPAGMLTFGETTLMEGTSHIASDRNGDYSHMSIDPVDNCTVWFTSEYGKDGGQWGTKVSSFVSPDCIDPNPGFTLSGTDLTQAICRAGDYADMTVSASGYNDFDGTVALEFVDLPAGFSGSFNPNAIIADETATATVTVAEDTPAGSYMAKIMGSSDGATSRELTAFLNVVTDDAPAVVLESPRNESEDISTVVTLTWETAREADAYTVEIASDAEFSNIVATAVVEGGNSYRPSSALQAITKYYWRVTATNICGGTPSEVYSFTTNDPTIGSTQLTNDTPMESITVNGGEFVTFYVDVPEYVKYLSFTLAADNGDADLYISKDEVSLTDFACTSLSVSSNEFCEFDRPEAGLWFALTFAYSAFSDASLTAHYEYLPPLISGFNPVAVNEDESVEITLDHLTIGQVSDLSTLTVIVSEGENYTVDGTTVMPSANYNGELMVNVAVSGLGGVSETVVLPVTVNAVNDAPVIPSTFSAMTMEDTGYLVTLDSLNVSDVDSESFTIVILEGDNYSIDGNTIMPAADFNGLLSVGIKVNDGESDSNVATLTLSVNAVNDAPILPTMLTATTMEDTNYVVTAESLNISDVDSHSFTIMLSEGENYSLAGNTIVPALNFNGELTVMVKVNDGELDSNDAVLTLAVSEVNDAPILPSDLVAQIDEDMSYTVAIESLGVVDVDSMSFTVLLAAGENYTVDGNTVTPMADFYGDLNVMVKVSDGMLQSNEVTLSLTVNGVNDAPTLPQNIAASVDEDMSYVVTIDSLNGTDVDGDDITFTLSEGDNYTLDGNTITPAANFNGVLMVKVVASDGELESDEATLDLIVRPVNDAPIAVDDMVQTIVESSALIDVLANDSDVDVGDTLTISEFTYAGNATIEISEGKIQYFAAEGFVGTDSFVYTITDSQGATASAEVTLNVSSPIETTVQTASRAGGGALGLISLLLLPLLAVRRRQFKA